MEHIQTLGHRIKAKHGIVKLCPETYCPLVTLLLKASIEYPAQTDGHGITKDEADELDAQLIEEMTASLKEKIETFVHKLKPHRTFVFESIYLKKGEIRLY